MQTVRTPSGKGVLLLLIFVMVCMVIPVGIGTSEAWAFRFIHPSNGDVIEAGKPIKIRIDPGEGGPLFGVLLMVSKGVSPAKLDSTPPYEWSIQIPKTYIGDLTFWAVVRRYTPVPNPPRATVTIHVTQAIIHAAQGGSSMTNIARENRWIGRFCRDVLTPRACLNVSWQTLVPSPLHRRLDRGE